MDSLLNNVRTVLSGRDNALEAKEQALKSLVSWADNGYVGAAELLRELAISEFDIEQVRAANAADRLRCDAVVAR